MTATIDDINPTGICQAKETKCNTWFFMSEALQKAELANRKNRQKRDC